MSELYRVATIGLGSMGFGMACSLQAAGLSVYGFDLSERQTKKFQEYGGLSTSLDEVAPLLNAVVLVVLNAEQTEHVLFGHDGLVPKLEEGAVIVSCATMAPKVARSLEQRCKAVGVHYLDAPISGGAVKAAAGQLSVMAAGSAAAFKAARPALDALAHTVFELGDHAGPGSAMKAVNQLLAGVHIASMAEAMVFGMKQGIDAQTLVDVITQSAGNSWMFENRAPHVVQGNYSPASAVDIWLKDLGIVLDIAKEDRFGAPLTAAALQQFVAASGSGWGAEDDAAVTKVYARNSNVDLPSSEH